MRATAQLLRKHLFQHLRFKTLVVLACFTSAVASAGEVSHYKMQARAEFPVMAELTYTFSVDDVNGDGFAQPSEITYFSGVYSDVLFALHGIGPAITTLGRAEQDVVLGGSSTSIFNLSTLKWTLFDSLGVIAGESFVWSDAEGKGTPNSIFTRDGTSRQVWDATEISEGELVLDEAEESTSGNVYLMTSSQSQNITNLHLINTSFSAQAFTGTLYSSDGEQLGAANVALTDESLGYLARAELDSKQLESLFSVEPWTGPAMLEVSGTGTFALMTKLTSPSGLVSNTNCVREGNVQNVTGFDADSLTYIRFINTGTEAITGISGSLFDASGQTVGQPNVTLIEQLAPKQAVWLTRDRLAAIVGAQWIGVASLQVEQSESLKLLNLTFENEETFFNFSCYESSDSGYVFLHTNSNSSNRSVTHVINDSDMSAQYTGTLYDQSGQQLGEANVPLHNGSIEPNARITLTAMDLESLVNSNPWSGPAVLQVEGSGEFDLLTRLTSPSGLVSNTNCVRRRSVHNIEGDDSSVTTYVRFINTGDTAITNITGTLVAKEGVVGTINSPLINSLGPREAIWLNKDEITALVSGESWNGTASLDVFGTEDANLRLLNLNFVNDETFFNFSCYEEGS